MKKLIANKAEDVTEMTLKERLEAVIEDIEDQAADKLKAAFPELFSDTMTIQEQAEPVKPFHYIDSNNILFRDARGRYYFWDELYHYAHGPYGDTVDACEALRSYGQQLEGGE